MVLGILILREANVRKKWKRCYGTGSIFVTTRRELFEVV